MLHFMDVKSKICEFKINEEISVANIVLKMSKAEENTFKKKMLTVKKKEKEKKKPLK